MTQWQRNTSTTDTRHSKAQKHMTCSASNLVGLVPVSAANELIRSN